MTHNDHEMDNMSAAHREQSTNPKLPPTSQITRRLSASSSVTVREPGTVKFHKGSWPLFVVAFYSALTLVSWVLLCVTNKRPIHGEKTYYDSKSKKMAEHMSYNENLIKAARILQSIATLIAIPVTSAICSVACVAYMQAGSLRKTLTLKQTMILADQGWISPNLWIRVVELGIFPLYAAFGLTCIGSISQIFQAAIVGQEAVVAGSYNTSSTTSFADILDSSTSNDMGTSIYHLQNLIASTSDEFYRANLWERYHSPRQRHNIEYYQRFDGKSPPDFPYPYIVPFPTNFNTGVHLQPQFAPRINSSLTYTNITESDFKRDCRNKTEEGGFYATYYYRNDESKEVYLSVQVCMTSDLRISPWNNTRNRQDITETLYLGTSLSANSYFKATATTSFGYFELPNNWNGNIAGPLLDKDPIVSPSDQLSGSSRSTIKRDTVYTGNANLAQTINSGPLTSLTLALFGPTSFAGTRMSNLSAFVEETEIDFNKPMGNCVAVMPFVRYGIPQDSEASGCVWPSSNAGQVAQKLSQFFKPFFYRPMDTQGFLETGLLIANTRWLSGRRIEDEGNKKYVVVHVDSGVPSFKPKISLAGVVVGSILLGLHLLGLVVLTVYASRTELWVGRLGAEAMVKMGMVYADQLGRADSEKEWDLAVNNLPGYIGDERPNEEIGRLRLGEMSGLGMRKGRKYEMLG